MTKATLDTGIVKKQAKEEVKIMSNQNNRIKNMIQVSFDNTTTQGELTSRDQPGDTQNKLYMINDEELNSFRNNEKKSKEEEAPLNYASTLLPLEIMKLDTDGETPEPRDFLSTVIMKTD